MGTIPPVSRAFVGTEEEEGCDESGLSVRSLSAAVRSSCLSRSGGRASNKSICWSADGDETLLELAVAVTEGSDTVTSSEDERRRRTWRRKTTINQSRTANSRNSVTLCAA